MASRGFALCALGALWTYLGPSHTCPQHKAAQADVVQKRSEWLCKKAVRAAAKAADGGDACW